MITKYKFGKKPYVSDPRSLQLKSYFKESLQPPPLEIHWPNPDPLGMLLNDQLGCCAIAGPCHAEMVWRQTNGIYFFPTDADVLAAYEAVGGYVEGDPSTDQGCNLLEVLKYWKNTGIAGRKIGAFAEVDFHDIEQLKRSIALFGTVIVGWALPASLDDNATIWTPPPNSLGANAPQDGHCTILSGYSQDGILDNITWGEKIGATFSYVPYCMDECWVAFSNDWLMNPNEAPNDIDIATLMQDLNQLS